MLFFTSCTFSSIREALERVERHGANGCELWPGSVERVQVCACGKHSGRMKPVCGCPGQGERAGGRDDAATAGYSGCAEAAVEERRALGNAVSRY